MKSKGKASRGRLSSEWARIDEQAKALDQLRDQLYEQARAYEFKIHQQEAASQEGTLARINSLHGPYTPYKVAPYDQLLTAVNHEIGHVLHPFATMSPEEIRGTFRPGSLEEIFMAGSQGVVKEVLEDISRLEQLRRLDKDEAARLILAVRAESSKPAESLPSTQDVADAYLTYMEDTGAAEGYTKVRARKLRFFARQYPKLPTDPGVIRAYLRQFKTADVPTRQDQWTALSALYKFASDTYDTPNPMLKVDKPRFRKKSGQRLSREQAKIFLAAVKTDLEWAIVTCYFGLRFRRVEADRERLRFGDIKSDYLVVQGKERTEELPLLPIFRDMLLKLQNDRRPNDPVFPIKADTLAYHIERIFKRAKIEGVRGSPHTLRNTAGALWSTFGGDWTSNRQLLRHSEKTMTDR